MGPAHFKAWPGKEYVDERLRPPVHHGAVEALRVMPAGNKVGGLPPGPSQKGHTASHTERTAGHADRTASHTDRTASQTDQHHQSKINLK